MMRWRAYWEVDGHSGCSDILAANRQRALDIFAERFGRWGYALVELEHVR